MATPQDIPGSAPARSNGQTHTTESTSPAVSFEHDELEALRGIAITAGQFPALAPALVKLLGIGANLPTDRTDASPLMHALQGVALYPFEADPGAYPDIHSGAFDAGLARVLAEDTGYPGELRNSGLIDQVGESFLYGRLIVNPVFAIAEGDLDEAHRSMVMDSAIVFRAGWVMACEASEREWRTREAKQQAETCGSLDDLVDLLSRKIHLGSVEDEALTSANFWTQAQVDQARQLVRAKSEGNLGNEGGAR